MRKTEESSKLTWTAAKVGHTGGEGILPDHIFGEGLHDGCIERRDGLHAKRCGQGVRQGGEM